MPRSQLHVIKYLRFKCPSYIFDIGLSLVASEFPTRREQMYGYVESSIGFGLMIGPVIGQALFSLLDFEYTFYGTSVILMIPGVLALLLIPARMNKPKVRRESMTSSQRRDKDRKVTLKMMLKNQRVVMACVSSIIAMIIMLFYDTIYSDRLLELEVSKNLVGNYFYLDFEFTGYIMALACLSYTISTPIVGWLA